jgi:hypothetical protein
VATAAAQGGLSKVEYADYEFKSWLFYRRLTVHAYGE